jgi:hypothetical protein
MCLQGTRSTLASLTTNKGVDTHGAIGRSQWPRGLKAWTFLARSNAGIVDSNPTQGMDVYCVRLFCICVLSVGRSLATGWPPSKKSYRLCIGSRNWKRGQGPTKGCRAIKIKIIKRNTENLPDEWKQSIVVPVHKKGDKIIGGYHYYQLHTTFYRIFFSQG